jgi:hypothetical protein
MDEITLTLSRDEFLALMKLTVLQSNTQQAVIAEQHGEDVLETLGDQLQACYELVCPAEEDRQQMTADIREIIQACMFTEVEDSGIVL